MKKLFTLFVALVAIAMGAQAQSIISMKAKVSINGGAVQEQQLPATGFPIVDLTDEATTSFVIKDIIVETSGSISDVYFFARVYKVNTSSEHEWGQVPLTPENGVWHISASTLEQMGFPNGVELIEPEMSSDPRYFEFYIVANNSISWNNGGENYKIMFSKGGESEAKVKFYKENTAGINISANGEEEKDITYTGDFVREKWYGWQPGEVYSLVIDDIDVTISCEDASIIKSVSMQYKVYEEGQAAQWNTLEATLYSTSGSSHRHYKAENLAIDVVKGLTSGKNYTLEIAYLVETTEGQNIYLSKGVKNDKFTFTVKEGAGVNEVAAEGAKVSGKCYNAAGQQVNAGSKGLLIQDGKKIIKQ